MTINDTMQEYLARRQRLRHPQGTFDRKSRWYPNGAEKQKCCARIRGPSAGFPYSLMVHCRTAEHVANLCGVPVADLRRLVNIWKRYGPESKEFRVALITSRLGVPIPLPKKRKEKSDGRFSTDSI